MARDLSAYLQDILEACIAIEDVMQDISLEEYRNQRAVGLPLSVNSSLLERRCA